MPGRRPLVAFVALFAAPLPACLHISAPPAPPDDNAKPTARAADAAPTPQAPKILFAELPRVPGTVVAVRPANPNPSRDTGAQKTPNTSPNGQPTGPPVHTAVGSDPPNPFPIAQSTLPPEPPLLAAVRAYTEHRPDRAIEIIRTLPKQNQDLALSLLPVLARAAGADLTNDPATVGVLVDQLHSAADRLEPLAALRIEKMAFCKDVSGFGRFVPWPNNQPYKPNAQAKLYLEVRNLGSQMTGDGFVTYVHAAVEVLDSHDRPVEQIDPDNWRRRVPVVRYEKSLGSHSPLHDFHVVYEFSVPSAPGVYTIAFELRDATGRRTVKTPPAQFCVAGP
jgi:hypothetical protein